MYSCISLPRVHDKHSSEEDSNLKEAKSEICMQPNDLRMFSYYWGGERTQLSQKAEPCMPSLVLEELAHWVAQGELISHFLSTTHPLDTLT